MIKIVNSNIDDIVKSYERLLLKDFYDKFSALESVRDLLFSKNHITEKDVKNNVRSYSSALKILMNIKDLYSSNHSGGKGKMTSDLIYSLNKLKVNPVKKSKCRKTKNIKLILNKVTKLRGFLNKESLFSALPKELIGLNDKLKNELEPVTSRFYNHFFDYTNYYDAINNGLGKALDLKTCPYCNRNYITYIPDTNKRVIGPSYDHFYSKSKFKYITVSFYNLIPSCYVCNSNLKGAIEFGLDYHIHPHLGGFGDDITFDFNLVTEDYLKDKKIIFEPFLKKGNSISLNKKNRTFGDKTEKDSGSINVFKLREVYKSHNDSVEEIYKRFDKNSPHYLGSISQMIKMLNSSEDEFYRYTFRLSLIHI